MPNIYQNGVGGTLGAQLATVRPLWTSGAVWYVKNGTGVDAASPAGRNREKPLATVAQAVTNASDGDIICFLDGHTQTLAAVQAVAKKLTFAGEGSASGVPTVNFTASGDWGLFSVSTSFVEFHNIKFKASTAANTNARVILGSTDAVIDGCYFECGANDARAISLASSSDRTRIRNTTVISVATSSAAQPGVGIITLGALADLELDGLVLSGGTVGFSNYFALDASAGAVTRLRGINCSLLLGADAKLHASSTGRFSAGTVTGGSRLEW